jgi:hypothetical protein
MTQETISFMTTPQIHFLDLHESPFVNDYVRFNARWLLRDDGPPKAAPRYFAISTGDLVALEQLFTGAGEFEGLYVVGIPEEDGRLPLLNMGIESVEWPHVILDRAGSQLRQHYEAPLNQLVSQVMPGMSLADLTDDVEEFWSNPVEARLRKVYAGEWVIPLSECTWKPQLCIS